MLEGQPFTCPWCGELNQVLIEPDEAGQTVIQDCEVCCAPVELRLPTNPGEPPIPQREGG